MEIREGVSIETKVYPIKEPKNNTLAMASLTIGGCFAVRGVTIKQGQNGPFVSMPQAKDGKGEWRDICFPTTKEGREMISQLVMDKYHEELNKGQQKAPAPRQAAQQQNTPQQRGGYSNHYRNNGR